MVILHSMPGYSPTSQCEPRDSRTEPTPFLVSRDMPVASCQAMQPVAVKYRYGSGCNGTASLLMKEPGYLEALGIS